MCSNFIPSDTPTIDHLDIEKWLGGPVTNFLMTRWSMVGVSLMSLARVSTLLPVTLRESVTVVTNNTDMLSG